MLVQQWNEYVCMYVCMFLCTYFLLLKSLHVLYPDSATGHRVSRQLHRRSRFVQITENLISTFVSLCLGRVDFRGADEHVS